MEFICIYIAVSVYEELIYVYSICHVCVDR